MPYNKEVWGASVSGYLAFSSAELKYLMGRKKRGKREGHEYHLVYTDHIPSHEH